MKRRRKLTALLMLLCAARALLPTAAADELPEQLVKTTAAKASQTAKGPVQNDMLIEQIASTYTAAKAKSKVKTFKGRCAAYVNRQLVLLGINKSYIGCNGNKAYDVYCRKETTDGGYTIHAYGAKQYSLEEALLAIEAENPHARYIMVGFQKGTSSAGKKYGHVLLIHGIENGEVYFSDSYAQTVEDVRYEEGEPIVCSIAVFCEQYKKYKLDGVIWFA